MITKTLDDLETIFFKTNEVASKKEIQKEKDFYSFISRQKDNIKVCQAIVKEVKDLSTDFNFDNIKKCARIIKLVAENPKIKKYMESHYNVMLKLLNPPDSMLSLLNINKDQSSIDPPQWGFGIEEPIKKCLNLKIGDKVKNLVKNSYNKLNSQLRKHRSLQIPRSIGQFLNEESIGFNEYINNASSNLIGYVKGAATAFNNVGSYLMHDSLDNIKKQFNYTSVEDILNSNIISGLLAKVLVFPLNVIYYLYLNNAKNKKDSSENTVKNFKISVSYYDVVNEIKEKITVDNRGTPILE